MTDRDTNQEAVAAFIRDALSRKGQSNAALARALGLDPSQGSRIVNGVRGLKLAEIPLVERFLETRLPGALMRSSEADGQEARLPPNAANFVSVPIYDLRAAAGPGAVAFDDAEPIDWLMFRESYLRRYATSRNNLLVLEITGDSNWPFLHHGDHALCDRGQINPRREGRYVIRIDDVLQVKLVSMNPTTRKLTVKADNPEYPSYDNIDPDEIAIVGRVIWIGRNLG